jgi:hypothetical protein
MIGSFIALGLYAGYRLSSIPDLRTYKLLNLAGLLYAFLGVLVLSEMLASNRWKDFCVRRLAPAILWFQTTVPIGALLGSIMAQIMRKPSSSTVTLFSISFWGYSVLAGFPFDEIVVFPKLPFVKRDVETRWRWLGFFLVLGGVGTQLIAAIMDLRQ